MAGKLEADQLAAFRQLRSGVDSWQHLNKKQKAWLDEACLLRYLRARKFDTVAAKNMIAETLEWRFIDCRPQKVTSTQVGKFASIMSSYYHMHTDAGHPL